MFVGCWGFGVFLGFRVFRFCVVLLGKWVIFTGFWVINELFNSGYWDFRVLWVDFGFSGFADGLMFSGTLGLCGIRCL